MSDERVNNAALRDDLDKVAVYYILVSGILCGAGRGF